jgi:ADP-dependent NAD(P)H-hydrate dehydratase / NAD(P)H-hydrate epimerase
MLKVLTAEQMREVDRLTTERYGIPSIILMENAAHAVAGVITEKLGGSVKGKSILILCGKGNNGGDGAALARILWTFGAKVHAVIFGDINESNGDAKINFEVLRRIDRKNPDLRVESVSLVEQDARTWWSDFIYNFAITKIDCVVDSVFGTGFHGPINGPLNMILETFWTNLGRGFADASIISVDLPSGFDADFAELNGWHFFPDVTVTFTSPKTANVLAPAAVYNGKLIIADIGSPPELINEQSSRLFLTERKDAEDWLRGTKFTSTSYKNKRGHALIIAGSDDYSGAAVMCGNSAMRSGVGLTTLLVPASCKVEVASRVIPEVIVKTLTETDGEVNADAYSANAETIRQADSILVGPGLKATDEGGEKLVREIVENRTVPVVVDAGALLFFNPPDGLFNGSPPYEGGVASAFFADDGVVLSSRGEETFVETGVENHPVAEAATPLLRKEGSLEDSEAASMRTGVSALQPLILTPHEGEFLRLLGTDDKDAIKDRVAAVRDYAVGNDVILVLKGERVLIGSPDGRVVVNPTGNSGLGKAGNGDTLAGILAGFTAQASRMGIDIFDTVVAAVYVAGMAGDVAEKKFGKRVMTASDVRECLVDVFADLSTTATRDI